MIASSVAKSVARSVASSTAGIASGGGGWSPLEISENARIYLADDATGSGSETLYAWNTIRDNRRWGDWIGRDSVFTYVDDGKLVMYGGWNPSPVVAWDNKILTNEIWISEDEGISWFLFASDEPSTTTRPGKRHLGARCYATFDGVDYVYMMGGQQDAVTTFPEVVDVWRKPLGDINAAWERMTADAGVGNRDNMFMGFLNGVLYAGGGNTTDEGQLNMNPSTDIWKSEDEGATWTLVNANCPWGKTMSCGQELLTRDNKLWKFGGWVAVDGIGDVPCTNDVWTYDGTSFVEVLADGHAQWGQRFYHNVALFDGEFYVITGHNNGPGNHGDAFRSADGATWTQLPAIPFDNTHAMSVWTLSDRIVMCNGYRVNAAGSSYGTLFDYSVHHLCKHAASRVSAWGDLTSSSDARPYLVTGFLAGGKKTLRFNGAQYLTRATQDNFSGAAAVLVAGYFPHCTNTNQAIIASATDLSVGVRGIGTYALDSNSDSSMSRFHPNKIQRGKLRTIAFSMDGSELSQWIDGEPIECDGETFTLSGWSRIGGGHTVTSENLKAYIVAIAVIPDSAVTQEQVDAFHAYALTKSGVSVETDPVNAIAPEQLLLKDFRSAHYTAAATKHLLRDYAGSIPGFAPQEAITGDGTNYVTIAYGSHRPGRTDGPITVEFSLKTPSAFSSRGLMCSVNFTESLFHWLIQVTAAGKLQWYNRTHTSGALASVATLSTSTWYRIKYVRTGSAGNWTIALYINGVLDSTNTGVTANPAGPTIGGAYLFDVNGAFSRFTGGSVADLRLTHDGHKWYIPLCEGYGVNTNAYRSDGVFGRQSTVTDNALWAGVMTEPASMCPNWLLNYGGSVVLGSSPEQILPGYLSGIETAGGADDIYPDIFPSKFSKGTINCDANGVGSVGLGLESALTPTTDRNTASSGKRRMRTSYGYSDRIAAKSTAISSSDANDYFGD